LLQQHLLYKQTVFNLECAYQIHIFEACTFQNALTSPFPQIWSRVKSCAAMHQHAMTIVWTH